MDLRDCARTRVARLPALPRSLITLGWTAAARIAERTPRACCHCPPAGVRRGEAARSRDLLDAPDAPPRAQRLRATRQGQGRRRVVITTRAWIDQLGAPSAHEVAPDPGRVSTPGRLGSGAARTKNRRRGRLGAPGLPGRNLPIETRGPGAEMRGT